MPESKKRTAAKKSVAVEADAGDIKVGDSIWFPNSRKPQEVTNITTEGEGDDTTIRIGTEGTSWVLKPDFKVRRA
jgi:hypothetical protein